MSNDTRIKLLGIALASALALASTAVAQHEGRRGPGRGPMGPGGPMGPLAMLRELDLSDDQRQQIRALFDEVEATGIPERLRQARESLHDSIESGADEATLRQQASELGEVEGDAAVEWARVRTRIQEVLTAEQKKELEQLKKEAQERRELFRKQHEERRARRAKDTADLL
jgi:Spy/CpxP family protein refolding chaperone